MLLNLGNGDLPPSNRVTLLAVRTELAFMDVGVAILAALADTCENGFDVTLRASNVFVHATEWILSLIVIEFRNGPNRLPCACGMTILTRDVQISVGTVCADVSLRMRSESEC